MDTLGDSRYAEGISRKTSPFLRNRELYKRLGCYCSIRNSESEKCFVSQQTGRGEDETNQKRKQNPPVGVCVTPCRGCQKRTFLSSFFPVVNAVCFTKRRDGGALFPLLLQIRKEGKRALLGTAETPFGALRVKTTLPRGAHKKERRKTTRTSRERTTVTEANALSIRDGVLRFGE